MAVIDSIKRNRRNPGIICALIVLVVMYHCHKGCGNPSCLQCQLKRDPGVLSGQSEPHTTSLSFPGTDALDKLRSIRSPALEEEILKIARASVTRVVQSREAEPKVQVSVQASDQTVSDALLQMQAGVFVTLIIDDRVRGCMGRIHPAEPNLRDEIAKAAEMAATMDIRHSPITVDDLPKLDFCISIVGRVRRERPDVNKSGLEGVLIKTGARSGVILPVRLSTADYQRKWAKREAGIGPDVPLSYMF